jgi:hypothetical protein
VVLLLYLMLAAVPGLTQSENSVPNVQAMVARMAQARLENRTRFRPYVVTRSYELFGTEPSKIKSQVIADVTFVPPNQKNYIIEQARGAGLGERAVRRILQSEAEAAKDYNATDYSPANYDFRFLHEEEDVEGQRSFVLLMLPKREDKNLLRGKIWVDADNYRVRRVEGEPAKSTSWWVRDVQIVLLYSEVDGMWLQTGMEATARVRILGPHRMLSNDMKYDISQPVATASSSSLTSRRRIAVEAFVNRDFTIHRGALPLREESLIWNSTKPYGLR